MIHKLTRRKFFHLTAGALAASRAIFSKEQTSGNFPPVHPLDSKSTVALTDGDQRRKIVSDSLLAIEEQILPRLRQKKYVVIKPNLVSTVNPLAATHADALHGILDFLGPRFKGPVIIAESSAGNTLRKFHRSSFSFRITTNGCCRSTERRRMRPSRMSRGS